MFGCCVWSVQYEKTCSWAGRGPAIVTCLPSLREVITNRLSCQIFVRKKMTEEKSPYICTKIRLLYDFLWIKLNYFSLICVSSLTKLFFFRKINSLLEFSRTECAICIYILVRWYSDQTILLCPLHTLHINITIWINVLSLYRVEESGCRVALLFQFLISFSMRELVAGPVLSGPASVSWAQ